jgi:hypothetical protein
MDPLFLFQIPIKIEPILLVLDVLFSKYISNIKLSLGVNVHFVFFLEKKLSNQKLMSNQK